MAAVSKQTMCDSHILRTRNCLNLSVHSHSQTLLCISIGGGLLKIAKIAPPRLEKVGRGTNCPLAEHFPIKDLDGGETAGKFVLTCKTRVAIREV